MQKQKRCDILISEQHKHETDGVFGLPEGERNRRTDSYLSGWERSNQMNRGRDGQWWKKLLLGSVIYVLLAALMYWIVAEDWSRTLVSTDAVNRDLLLPEMTEGMTVTQSFTVRSDRLQSLQIQVNPLPERQADDWISFLVRDGGETLLKETVPLRTLSEDGSVSLSVDQLPGGLEGKRLMLEISGSGGVSLWAGTTRSAGKYDISAEVMEVLEINGEKMPGELVMTQMGESPLSYRRYFWPAALALGALVAGIAIFTHSRRRKGKPTTLNRTADLIRQYEYLLKTLVVRDFKVRYKASVLGVLWSFLNPLLMTFVYYFVFSTIFRSSIPKFPIYLMSGIVLYNYFSEATNMGMQSIVGNAGLITKVYMPKYIFPISKAISSAINLVISMIPLLVMMAVTGVSFHKSLLLLPLVILYLVVFCVGVSLLLSACMVYFRDVQFLWGITLTILNFFSPIFYPESIIPARFITLYHCNPLYQFLYFMRTIVIGGISPLPITYFYCTLLSFGVLGIGLLIFRKAQTQFVLHL